MQSKAQASPKPSQAEQTKGAISLSDIKRIRKSLTSNNPYLVPPPLPLPHTSPRSDLIYPAYTGAEEDLPAIDFKEPERCGFR